LAVVIALAANAQSTSSRLEVASIKRCVGGRVAGTPLLEISAGRLTLNCAPTSFLIETAYFKYANPQDNPSWRVTVEGGPIWIRSEFYQVSAKAEDPNASPAILGGAMLREFLEDRLKLKLHSETVEITVYALTLGKEGKDDAKLRSHDARCSPCAGLKFSRNGRRTLVAAEGVSLDELYRLQGIALNRPVVNRTGITGSYSFQLEFEPESAQGALQTGEPVGPSIFDALENQLGVKLVESRGPSKRLIVDSIERPSEN
jgi:uncharacterized protein (TIGR03435 family)